jgi:hypothetical protein
MRQRLAILLVSASAVLCAMVTPAAARRRGMPRPYLVTDSGGRYYARCIPGRLGKPGSTRIFRVGSVKDELVDEYQWFARSRHHRLYLLTVGFDRRTGKPRVAVFRPHDVRNALGPDKQVEFSIYLAGKLVRSYTTKDLTQLGAKVVTNAGHGRTPKGDYAAYKFNGYDGYLQEKSPNGCFSFTIGGKIILIDIATGNVLKSQYPNYTEKAQGSSTKAR